MGLTITTRLTVNDRYYWIDAGRWLSGYPEDERPYDLDAETLVIHGHTLTDEERAAVKHGLAQGPIGPEKARAMVAGAESLQDLCALLNDIRPCVEFAGTLRKIGDVIDLDSLPTFGGETPDDTHDILSWDATHLLVRDEDEQYRFTLILRGETTKPRVRRLIKEAKSLQDLCDALNSAYLRLPFAEPFFDRLYCPNLLPTFGGDEPADEDIEGVWSWDATHLIVRDPDGEFVLVPRG